VSAKRRRACSAGPRGFTIAKISQIRDKIPPGMAGLKRRRVARRRRRQQALHRALAGPPGLMQPKPSGAAANAGPARSRAPCSPIACATLCTGLCCALNVAALYFLYALRYPDCLFASAGREYLAPRLDSLPTCRAPGAAATPPPPDGLRLAYETAPRTYALVFSTGRAGTQHLSRLFAAGDAPGLPRAYVTHQEEDGSMGTRDFVRVHYRALASSADEAAFNASARAFLAEQKLPFIQRVLRESGASRFVYTGHLPLAFGLGPSLVAALPRGTLRILRLRRDRIASALSLMALGPEDEDPWGTAFCAADNVDRRRWFPAPTSAMVRVRVGADALARFNRFQKWLWYVDDVECRWQALLAAHGGDFEWMEESLEGLEVMDGGRGWQRVANFLGVALNSSALAVRDNSMQAKHREKGSISEAVLRQWDEEYRRLVGRCDLSGDGRRWLAWNAEA
jgi:hypothetical protein